MTRDWEEVKDDIRQLYLEQDLTCTEVILEMQRRGFHKSRRSYKNCFKRWGFRKTRRRAGNIGTLPRGSSIDQGMPVDDDDTTASPLSDHANPRHSQTTHLVSFAPSTTVAYPTSLPGPHASGHPEIGEPLSVIDQTFANFFSNLEEELAYTKLHQAVLNEQVDEVKALLSRGAPIDVPDRKGNLPVHYTAGHQDEKIAKFLLGYRVGKIEPLVKQDLARLTLDYRNTDGNTPMHLAISARSLNYDHQRSIVTHLLGAGANPYIPNNLGVTPIQKAVELVSPTMSWDHGHHIDKMLTAKAAGLTSEKRTSLFKLFLTNSSNAWADVNSHLNALFRSFLGNDADPDVTVGPNSQRLLTYFLHYCYKTRSTSQKCDTRLATLICKKLDVARVNSRGETCVHQLIRFVGAWYYDPSIYELLQIVVERGADVNHLNTAQQSPLMLLLEKRQLVDDVYTVLAFLLSRGANPLIPDAAGNFPIYVAIRNNPWLGSKLAKMILHVDNGLDTTFPWRFTWWQSWMQAITSEDWGTSVTMLQQTGHSPPRDIQALLYRLALAVLAEKHLRRAKDWYENSEKSPEQQDQHRTTVRNILLKSPWLDIDTDWFLYLLKL
ncbi:hypothetical protein KXW98_009023 [Aspergillus fumigatus]|nr:hypothetical protein KXX10_004334 [Aspergillus fumigatus]KAH2382343.1 hypothetical protein KXV41_000242 [Aspergillus fumigatus]KAH2427875.1 hypothetical protein KXW64_001743 [Aspergillus fumigatus]KAH3045645.1 hypothetical protein KXW83_004178 [Aspergillus fumigatus]KAH3491663.1 hypothetical protein KXW98_009023 [Aspergillus fumigatus]